MSNLIKFLQLLRKQIESSSEEYKKMVNKIDKEIIDPTLYDDMKATLDFLLEDPNNIRELDIDKIVDYFYENDFDSDLEIDEYKEVLRQIQVITEGNVTDNLGFELTDEQIAVLTGFIDNLGSTIKSIDTRIAKKEATDEKSRPEVKRIQDEVLEYKFLYDKIVGTSDNKQLDLKDFDVVSKILAGKFLTDAEKVDFLVGLKGYIDEVKKHGYMNVEGVNIESFIKLLKDEYKFGPEMSSLILRNKEEIKTNGDFENIKRILGYMTLVDDNIGKASILKRFDNETLLSILVYGSEESVRNRYQALVKEGLDSNIFYSSSNGWVSRVAQKESDKTPRRVSLSQGKNTSGYQSNTRLRSKLNQLSPEEQLANVEYLGSKGFDVDASGKRTRKILGTPLYRIMDNYAHLTNYGLFANKELSDFPVCVLSMYNTIAICDKYIEAGLYNYLYDYTSSLIKGSPEFFAALFKIKNENSNDEYFNKIFSKKTADKPCIAERDIRTIMYTINDVESFLDENGRYKGVIPGGEQFEDCIYTNELNAEISYDKVPESLTCLEQNHKVNDYMYQFGDQTISRLKVIRNYSILETHGLANNENALMYSITRNSLLTEEAYTKIADAVSFGKQGKVGGVK